MVQVIEPTTTDDTPVYDTTVSFEEAMTTLGIDRGALRKRLDRGSTVQRVGVRVRILDTE